MLTPNLDRLKRLRALLETKPPEKVHLNHWRRDCGTVFCAVGWATQDPEFQAEGLWLDFDAPINPVPAFQGEVHWGAVETFFGLTSDQAEYLFMPIRCDEECSYGGAALEADPPETIQQGGKAVVLRRLDIFIGNVEAAHA